MLKSNINKIGVGVMGLVGSSMAMAATDYSTLTSAVSFTDLLAAILAVAALIAGFYVAIKGIKRLLAFLNSKA